MLHSNYRPLNKVTLPPFQGRQMYMHTFDLARPGLPVGYEDYYRPVIQLIRDAFPYGGNIGLAHLTVDEKIVQAGTSQRKPRPHVDGCFVSAKQSWHHGWLHTCNDIGRGPITRMPVIVVSSVPGCKAWRGEFDVEPKNDGDLSHLTLPQGELLAANVGYLLSADCVHESLVFDQATQRTFIRIALPVEYKF